MAFRSRTCHWMNVGLVYITRCIIVGNGDRVQNGFAGELARPLGLMEQAIGCFSIGGTSVGHCDGHIGRIGGHHNAVQLGLGH